MLLILILGLVICGDEGGSGETCTPTDTNCLQCTSDPDTCTKCKPNFGLDGGSCNECTGGQTSDGTKPCEGGSGETCTPTDTNCLQCTSDPDTCTKCKPNFGLDGGSCNECTGGQTSDGTKPCEGGSGETCTTGSGDTDCKTCDIAEKDKCGSCNSNSILKTDKTCEACPSGQKPNAGQTACEPIADIDCTSTIKHCSVCDTKTTCKTCEEGYKGTTCNECDAGYEGKKKDDGSLEACIPNFYACNPSEKPFGCKYCDSSYNKCVICDERYNSIEKVAVDGKCQCKDDYELVDSICVRKRGKCNKEIPGCISCFEKEPGKCAVCIEESYLDSKDTCTCHTEGYEFNEKGDQCIPPTETGCNADVSIPGCLKCGNDKTKCSLCDESKNFDSDPQDGKCKCYKDSYEINNNGVCDVPEKSGCNETIPGCLKCDDKIANKCIFCDEEQNYQEKANSNGVCICKDYYDLTTNGLCLSPLKQIGISDEYKQPMTIPELYAKPDGTTFTLDIPNDAAFINNNKYGLYSSDVGSDIKDLAIVKNVNDDVKLNILGSELNIASDDNAVCNLVLTQTTNTLNFDQKSNGISIENQGRGSKSITLNNSPGEDGKVPDATINLKNLTTENIIELNPMQNVIFDYINLFKDGQVEKSKTDKTISANHVNIQQGAVAVLKGIKIEKDLTAAPSSTIDIDDTVEYENKAFKIIYSQAQEKDASIFEGTIKKVPGSIEVLNSESDIILEERETMTIAKETPANFDNATCDAWAKKVSGSFSDAVCEKSQSENKVVAKKTPPATKKKNKLSGGAIAGIVIACVVVVAAIIALLVYFLVIKKKNKSTTSTQGDSSIAI